jgi:hypothetical protein
MVRNVDQHGMAGAGDQLKLGVGKLLDEWLGEGRTAEGSFHTATTPFHTATSLRPSPRAG